MCTLNETRVDESILLLKILRRIPCERWISTSEIAHELDESGLHIAPRRLQRILKRITSTDEFSVQCDIRSKPYGYRRLKTQSDLAETHLRPEDALVLRLSEERLRYLLPSPVMASLRPLFDKAREIMKEEPAKAPSAAWLKKSDRGSGDRSGDAAAYFAAHLYRCKPSALEQYENSASL